MFNKELIILFDFYKILFIFNFKHEITKKNL